MEQKAKVMEGFPAARGFRMPAEWEPHDQCWIGWPNARGAWRDDAVSAQKAFANVVHAISKFEPITVCTNPDQYAEVYGLMKHNSNVRVVEMSLSLVWLRDLGPTFLVHDSETSLKRGIAGVDWKYNGYGDEGAWKPKIRLNWRKRISSQLKKCFGCQESLTFIPYSQEEFEEDKLAKEKVLELERIPRFATNFVLEGGSIHVDGEGTCITTESCLLHGNRNPNLTKGQIEDELKNYLGVSKIIWLPKGLYGDEGINGHVDNICCFVRPGVVLLAWIDDESDPQYEHSTAALSVLSNTTDAMGRKLEIIKIHVPGPLYEAGPGPHAHLGSSRDSRASKWRLAASYVNFYIANGGIIAPAFGDKYDEEARRVLEKAFPDHEVIMVEGGREIVAGGGNIHCTTQQQPAIYPFPVDSDSDDE